jgi:predicted dienelactone hydrolase
LAGHLIALVLALLFAGSLEAAILDETWIDPARGGRAIPVRLYLPEEAGPHPVVIFTPGLGQGRGSAAYLGDFWSSRGYVALFLQHPGTDSELTLEQQKRAGLDGRALAARYLDLPFSITQLLKRASQPGPLQGRVIADRLAVAGHSLGAVGAAIAVGRKTSAGTNLADPRLRAAVLMSPTPGPGDAAANFSAVNLPVLHLTGIEDRDESVPRDVSQRFKPFGLIRARPQVLVVFRGGDHLVFSASPQEVEANPRFRPIQASVQEITTRFLDAILKDDASAQAWLSEGGLAAALAHHARVEIAR